MIIHTVTLGETLHSISEKYGVPESRILIENALDPIKKLIVGQTLLIGMPEKICTVRGGDTLQSIAERNHISLLSLLQNNPQIHFDHLTPSQTLNIAYEKEGNRQIAVSAYTATASFSQVEKYLPYITNLHIQNAVYVQNGEISLLENAAPLVSLAKQYHALPILTVECTDERGRWCGRKAVEIFESPKASERFLTSLVSVAMKNGFSGIEIHLFAENSPEQYKLADFLLALHGVCAENGLLLSIPVLPTTNMPLDLGDMLPVWSYIWDDEAERSPVAPINCIEKTLQSEKMYNGLQKFFLGIPTFGVEYIKAGSKNTKNTIPVADALQHVPSQSGVAEFDEATQTPFVLLPAGRGYGERLICYEDARSYSAKLDLVDRYNLSGVNVMSLAYDAPLLWRILNQRFYIKKQG